MSYINVFAGDVIQPTDVSYYALSFSTDTQLYWPAVVNPTQVPAARIMDCVASLGNLSIVLPDASPPRRPRRRRQTETQTSGSAPSSVCWESAPAPRC